LIENYGGQAPTIQDCKGWADMFGITFPVLADVGKTAWNLYKDSSYVPLIMIIDRKMVIQYKEPGYNETIAQTLENKIKELLSQ
jgi:hypothetical protein